jgi:hypothetical protein
MDHKMVRRGPPTAPPPESIGQARRPNLRQAAKALGVPKSTIARDVLPQSGAESAPNRVTGNAATREHRASTANKLMKIGACDHLRNSEHVPNLPVHWGTLFELTLLTAEQFNHGIESGAINPKMQRKDDMKTPSPREQEPVL